MIANISGLGATDTSGIAPGYPYRAWPVNLEDRDSARALSIVCPNGSVAATSHPALGEIFTRCLSEEWDEIRGADNL